MMCVNFVIHSLYLFYCKINIRNHHCLKMKRIEFKISTVFVAFVLTINIQAQEQLNSLLGISYTASKLKNDTLKGSCQNIDAFVNLPLFKMNDYTAIARIGFSQDNYKNLAQEFNHRLTTLNLTAFLLKKIDEKNKLQFMCKAGLYSDFEDIGWKDFRYSLGINWWHTYSKRLKVGTGIAFARQFRAYQISPFASMYYQINDKLLVSGLFPVKPRISYFINKQWIWYNEITSNVESFRLSGKKYDNQIIEFSGWKGTSGLEYTLKEKHHFMFGLGYSFRENMRLYDDVNKNNWKLFTFNLTDKVVPVSSVKVKELSFMIKYNLTF